MQVKATDSQNSGQTVVSQDTCEDQRPSCIGKEFDLKFDATGQLELCRICFDERIGRSEKCQNQNKLVSPCNCKGTIALVHQKCLSRWNRVQSQEPKSKCEICHQQYSFELRRRRGRNLCKHLRTFTIQNSVAIFIVISQLLLQIMLLVQLCKVCHSYLSAELAPTEAPFLYDSLYEDWVHIENFPDQFEESKEASEAFIS